MNNLSENNKEIISYRQLFLLALAQLGGASIIYLPGTAEAGKDVWISNIIASMAAYVVIYCHYLPLSLCPGCSMTKTLNKYWGKFFGGLVNLYYFLFFFILSCLIVSDVFYFGKITMPETPGVVFIIFFLIPGIYAVKLGLETIARFLEFLLPALVIVYCTLFLLVMPKLVLDHLRPILAEGMKPVLAGAIPNMNFPYAQILPVAFFYKYTRSHSKGGKNFLKPIFGAIFAASILLTFRSMASIAAFDEATLITLPYPPFSTIRLIEVGDVLERLDAFLLAVFYGTTFIKFILTCYVMCEIISDYFQAGEPKDFSMPVAVLIGVSMPILIPRFDIILKTVVPYFFSSLPLFAPIPLLLYMTIRIRKKEHKSQGGSSI
ncbi:spore germination protein (amino acid permease) [Geosporobacter subterraneus DSM 17957]|uniref:Spore germination protein (Amino acid permease) n=1 Tax=Geosporobacter subterraneus DSM 17957 TaxID=1121919 RepID=A0A1M6PBX8_9FIRM|nr:endospore germination permease [Geosporobacter subterraneus]SHK05372.1 spore germination protein (amino acid permease) [Geosporobacter subterraneus DSM 17957]